MSVKTGQYLNTKDVYIDYPYEEVMFRRTKDDGAIYRKFYGEQESTEVISNDNRLFNDALLSGYEITPEEYEIGKNEHP